MSLSHAPSLTCRGLIDGATTLELDNGVTKVTEWHQVNGEASPHDLRSLQDGVVVVWHDEKIVAAKCEDTSPAVSHDFTVYLFPLG